MRRGRCLSLLTAGACLVTAGPSHAEGLSGLEAAGIIATGVTVAGGSAALTATDLAYLLDGRRTPLGFSIAEAFLGTAQAASASLLISGTGGAARGVVVGLVVWGGVLALHGVVSTILGAIAAADP